MRCKYWQYWADPWLKKPLDGSADSAYSPVPCLKNLGNYLGMRRTHRPIPLKNPNLVTRHRLGSAHAKWVIQWLNWFSFVICSRSEIPTAGWRILMLRRPLLSSLLRSAKYFFVGGSIAQCIAYLLTDSAAQGLKSWLRSFVSHWNSRCCWVNIPA